MRDGLVNQGIRITRSDEPSRIVAEIGDWKHSFLLSRPWADVTVTISEADHGSHVGFTFDFLKMYSILLAFYTVAYLSVASILWVLTGLSPWPFQASPTGVSFFFILVFLLFVSTAPRRREMKERFMTEVDRFLPSVW